MLDIEANYGGVERDWNGSSDSAFSFILFPFSLQVAEPASAFHRQILGQSDPQAILGFPSSKSQDAVSRECRLWLRHGFAKTESPIDLLRIGGVVLAVLVTGHPWDPGFPQGEPVLKLRTSLIQL